MTNCHECKYYEQHEYIAHLGFCIIKLPPWMEIRLERYVGDSMTTRHDSKCDLGVEKVISKEIPNE